MSIHVIKDSTREIVDLLANYLPKIVWIGPRKDACQPAYLTRENDYLEYVMSNEKMKSILPNERGEGDGEGLVGSRDNYLFSAQNHYFSEWKEFEQWTEEVLKEANNIEQLTHKLNNMSTIKKTVNSFFQYEIFEITLNNDVSSVSEIAFQSQSVKLLLQQHILDLEFKLKNEKDDIVVFLLENNFSIDVDEDITPQTAECLLESFKENYNSTNHFDIEHVYNVCSLDLDVVTYEMFAEIANISITVAILYLQKKREEREERKRIKEEEETAKRELHEKEEREKQMRQQMRNAWTKKI